jgi:isoleucyl-tRNA synthetase
MTYSNEWRHIIGRFGRWIDFDNDYKTMDKNFMESVWWTFKQIYDKGLVYRGSRIMPYSTGCTTVLSNFEAGSNYKFIEDPAIIVSFPVLEAGEEDANFIAWTTTPWTLPSNLALAVNPKMKYIKIVDEGRGKTYIVAEPRLQYTLKFANIKKHTVVKGWAKTG